MQGKIFQMSLNKIFTVLMSSCLMLFCLNKAMATPHLYTPVFKTQQIHYIIVEVSEVDSIFLNKKNIKLEDLSVGIDSISTAFKSNGFEINSLAIKIFTDTPESLVTKIKAEVKKTSIKLIDVQVRKEVTIKKVNDSMVVRYNSIIERWKSQDPEDRVFTKEEVLYVRETYKKMDFKQIIKAQKLPGFIPNIEELDSLN